LSLWVWMIRVAFKLVFYWRLIPIQFFQNLHSLTAI
jgi:hypothetical protein